MPHLISQGERVALRLGENTLGGHRASSVSCVALAKLLPAAIITVGETAAPTVRRLSTDIMVAVNGERLGWVPRPVRNGDEIEVAGRRLVYDEADIETVLEGEGVAKRGDADPNATAVTGVGLRFTDAAATRGQLVELRTGRDIPIADSGLVLGRDAACHVVVPAKEVTRRHATVRPNGDGYTVADHSANGTYVNGERVDGERVLRHGDVLRVGAEEFRFDSSAPATAPPFDASATIRMTAIPPRPGASRDGPAVGKRNTGAGSTVLATLQSVRWGRPGAVFKIERPVCAIGRGERSDVRLDHISVSAAHASLILKGGTWYVIDLGSRNGTYVDGYSVAGERALTAGCTLRVGEVKLVFQPVGGRIDESMYGTRRVGGLRGWWLEQLR